ncbi:MAG: hypothetical protein Q7R35_08840 [Elusimicrobiota bacterium]|nr:hypothetical protein [Elusimicrobiota bacterium]
MDKNNMETVFNDLCSNIEKKKCPDLWPRVRIAIEPTRNAAPKYRSLRAVAFAAASLAVVLCIPGVAQSIKDRLARIFSSQYSVKLLDSPEMTGVLVSTDGEMRELKSGNTILQVKTSSFEDKMVKIEAFVYEMQEIDGKPVRKLIAKPVIVGVIGRPLEIRIGNTDRQKFVLKMTPSERDMKDYSAALIPQYLPETLSKTDAIKREVLDIEAMYWAWRISKKNDAPYEKVEKYICAWDIKPSTRDELLAKIRDLVATGKARPLTPAEEKTMKESEKTLFKATEGETRYSAGLLKKIAMADEINRKVLDVEAEYWAWRITGIKDMTYSDLENDSKGWVMSPEFRQTLCDKVQGVIASGKSRPLTVSEEQRYAESRRQLRELSRSGK